MTGLSPGPCNLSHAGSELFRIMFTCTATFATVSSQP